MSLITDNLIDKDEKFTHLQTGKKGVSNLLASPFKARKLAARCTSKF